MVMYVIIGFALFGVLLGFVVGISSATITEALVVALFSFIAGKLFIDIEQKEKKIQKTIGLILSFFSFFCLAGILTGIYVKVNESLGRRLEKKEQGVATTEPYLKSTDTFINSKIQEYRQSRSTNCDSILDIIENDLRNAKK